MQTDKRIKQLIKTFFRILVSFFMMIGLYLFVAVLLSVIPVHQNQAGSKEIEIFLRTNGVHLEIILPVQTENKDWAKEPGIKQNKLNHARYVSFGWGDENFFRYTPEWSDLTFSTAFRALFLKSQSAIHVDYYTSLSTNKGCKKVDISEEQYLIIVDFISSGFERDGANNLIPIDGLHYSEFDSFYKAKRSYSLFFTCNTWTNKCLKTSGLKASLWTPFDKGILYHYQQ